MEKNLSLTDHFAGRKILFANFPADGHFNPLTGLAMHLKSLGADVRWYSSVTYAGKLKKMNIPHYCFKKAVDVEGNNFDKAFPERTKKKSQVSKLKYDIIHAFILRGPEYYADILEIHESFSFDLLVADSAFTGIPFVKDLMRKPVIAIGVMPLTETSADLPPAGLGMEPSDTWLGRIKQSLLRGISNQLIFREPNRVLHLLFDKYRIAHNHESLFDMLIAKCDLLLQSGTPSFEYHRSDLSENVRFIGPLLPYSNNQAHKAWFDQRLNQYERVFLVTQGTVEKDVEKLLVPVLEAFKDSTALVVCTTGGSKTAELRARYPQSNLIIEDFIPFGDVMPYTDVYITNGGYGGVMLGIENNLPLVVAGVHEGKNEINARVGYFKLGVNLKTEKPTSQQIRTAVEKVIAHPQYKENAIRLSMEFCRYRPASLFAEYAAGLLSATEGREAESKVNGNLAPVIEMPLPVEVISGRIVENRK
jgi:UDP:flavonoid glycosyltransferase YjiC (YdhE family)